MKTLASVDVVLAAFDAVERRDDARLASLCEPNVEFHWPPSLPYGGLAHGIEPFRPNRWADTWNPLQPTQAERRMDPRVLAATAQNVVVRWYQRGVAPNGERFEDEVVGLYHVRRGKLSRAQMYYFDPTSVSAFLKRASEDEEPFLGVRAAIRDNQHGR